MAELVTFDEARRQVRVADPNPDEDTAASIELYRQSATDIVIDYLKRADPEWTADTVPAGVKAAVLLVIGALFHDREGGDPLSDAAKSLLHRYRDPALA